MIKIEGAVKRYMSGKQGAVTALDGVDLVLPDRGMVFIVGKSGSGKSTLLNVLGLLDGLDGGEMYVDGKAVKEFTAREADAYRSGYVGFVFQEFNLLENDTVRRNIEYATDLIGEKQSAEKTEELLAKVGLEGLGERKAKALSGGQRQRVAIARAAVKEPKLLLCDEPTGALDSATGKDIFLLLKELSKRSLVVVVTHDEEAAEEYGDRVIGIKDGKICSDTGAEEAEQAPTRAYAQKGGHISARSALHLGAGYLRMRPVRLAITLLLCFISFVLMGFSDAVASYDKNEAARLSMTAHGTKYLRVHKDIYTGEQFGGVDHFIEGDFEILKEKVGASRIDPIYREGAFDGRICVMDYMANGDELLSLARALSGFIEIDEDFLADYNFSLMEGSCLPQGEYEIVIDEYLYDEYVRMGFKNADGECVTIRSSADLIGRQFVSLDDKTYTIVGILDTGFDFEYYEEIMEERWEQPEGHLGELNSYPSEFSADSDIYTSLQRVAFVADGYFDDYIRKPNMKDDDIEIKSVLIPYNAGKGTLDALTFYVEGGSAYFIVELPSGRVMYNFANAITEDLRLAEARFLERAHIARYISYLFLFFSVLLIFHYFSGTVVDKKKEVGVLRALGASKRDIFSVYLAGNLLLAAIMIGMAYIGTGICIFLLEYMLRNLYALIVRFIVFGLRQFLLIAAVAIVSVALGVAVPAWRVLRKRPVDMMRDE